VFVGFEPGEHERIVSVCRRLGNAPRFLPIETDTSASAVKGATVVVLNLTPAVSMSQWFVAAYLRSLQQPFVAVGECSLLLKLALVQARASEVVIRPFTEDQLLFHVWRAMARAPSRAAAKAESSGVRILVADDDPSITTLAATILRDQGFQCHEAHDGKQALDLARRVLPHLLVLDVGMPQLSGFDVLKILRDDPSTSAMKIVLLTGSDRREDVARGIELGANGYFYKPFRPLELLRRIRVMLPDPQAATPLREQAAEHAEIVRTGV
jgi:CheY-like chemotaxis protein